jgi:transketolase
MSNAALEGAKGNKIANRQAISETLLDLAKENKDILVLTSDSRGSASLVEFGLVSNYRIKSWRSELPNKI